MTTVVVSRSALTQGLTRPRAVELVLEPDYSAEGRVIEAFYPADGATAQALRSRG